MLVNIVMEKTWAGMFAGVRNGWAFGLLAVGAANWGLMAGRSQSYEPREGMWKEIGHGGGKQYNMTKWFRDRITRFNKLADDDFAAGKEVR